MKKLLFTLLLLTIPINLYAQKSDLIVGNWVFTKALNENIDEAGLAFMKAEVIGKWKFEFKSDGKFNTYMMGQKANGEWKLLSEANILVLNGVEGGPQEFKILKTSKNELALRLGLGEFLLTRIKQ